MRDAMDSRRFLKEAVRRLLDVTAASPEEPQFEPPRLTFRPSVFEALRMSRPRDRILSNLDEMYREAFDRAKAAGDDAQMKTLDFAYRREQLYFEILLDVRDALERK